MKTGNDNLKKLYEGELLTMDEAQNFLIESYPPLTRSHLLAFGEKINGLTSRILGYVRQLQIIKIQLNKDLKSTEKKLLKTCFEDKKSIQFEPEYVDKSEEIQFIEVLISSMNSLLWALKDSKVYFVSIYKEYVE